MRPDRLLTLCFFGPLARTGIGNRQPSLPVLMYHSISDTPGEDASPYYQTTTSPEVFAQQMELLSAAGYRGMNLSEGLRAFKAGTTEKGMPVALTFDDGFRDFLTEAHPQLAKHGFSATVFLPTAQIGDTPRQFKSRDCLTWGEVHSLHRAGIEFGSHTVTHPMLVNLEWPAVERELRDSKAEIEQQLGQAVDTFAYPYAFPGANRRFVNRFKQALADAGYTVCATTEVGRVHAGADPHRLKRLPVNSWDDAALLRAKLEGGYDWLALPQTAAKQLKQRLQAFHRRNGAPPKSSSART